MELKRMRHWIYFLFLVRAGRCCTRTREQMTRTYR
jgi:hypothetical protein